MFNASITKKDLIMSIQPQWVYKIWNKTKTIEVRKTKSKYKPKFRIFIYCTRAGDKLHRLTLNSVVKGVSKRDDLNLNGKIVAHCTCPEIKEFKWDEINHCYDISSDDLQATCLTQEQLYVYGKGKTLYGYVLSHVMPYPGGGVPITEAYNKTERGNKTLTTAPQSWGYVDGVGPI